MCANEGYDVSMIGAFAAHHSSCSARIPERAWYKLVSPFYVRVDQTAHASFNACSQLASQLARHNTKNSTVLFYTWNNRNGRLRSRQLFARDSVRMIHCIAEG